MTLTHAQFDVAVALARAETKSASQREIAKRSGHSLGAVNTALAELAALGFVEDKSLTQAGQAALEPFRVKRAILLAAGFGQRLIPITFNTPKPLVRVKGQRIIDTLLDALIAAGITDITIVRGYLAEQFDQLTYKYPSVKFIDNAAYLTSNNISSAFSARFLLKNAYVLEADLFLKNPALISPYQFTSNYLGVPVDQTDDWCFQVGSKNVIKHLSLGGRNCRHMFGISYWNAADGSKLAEDIKAVYEMPGGKEMFWDQVPLQEKLERYTIEVRACSFDDIAEVDTLDDLRSLDPQYGMTGL